MVSSVEECFCAKSIVVKANVLSLFLLLLLSQCISNWVKVAANKLDLQFHCVSSIMNTAADDIYCDLISNAAAMWQLMQRVANLYK